MLAEATARNTKLRQQVTNVGRPTASALTKQGEIKNKILEDSDEEPDADDKKVKKNPKGVDTDDENDPKELKGGKTEVIINPKTNDNSEDQDDENKASKKITNKVNKDIGAKGVKEETMTNKNFGLPDALINAVREIVNEKKDIYAAMKARQFAKSAVKEKDPIKKAEHEKKSDEYKTKINKEEVETLDEVKQPHLHIDKNNKVVAMHSDARDARLNKPSNEKVHGELRIVTVNKAHKIGDNLKE